MNIYKMLNKRTNGVVAQDHRTVQVWYKTCVTIHSLIIMKDTLTTANPWGSAAVLWAAAMHPHPTSLQVLLQQKEQQKYSGQQPWLQHLPTPPEVSHDSGTTRVSADHPSYLEAVDEPERSRAWMG